MTLQEMLPDNVALMNERKFRVDAEYILNVSADALCVFEGYLTMINMPFSQFNT